MEDQAYKCVIMYTQKYSIDESHGLKHSIEVARFAEKIYDSEVGANPHLVGQKNVILAAAILHDMCDRKYVPNELDTIGDIRDSMKEYITASEFGYHRINHCNNVLLEGKGKRISRDGRLPIGIPYREGSRFTSGI